MTPAALLNEARNAGVTLWREGDVLRYRGPREALAKLLPALKAHKPDILAALAHPDPLPPLSAAAYKLIGYFEERLAAVQRYAPTELHMNSRPPTVAAVRDAVRATMALAQARGFAQREVIEALEGYPEAKTFLLAEIAARLSAGDLADIAAGDIPPETVQAFEQAAVTRETEDLAEFFEERAGILEHDAGFPRVQAEIEAARITATYARNRRYLWAILRSALSGYPLVLSQVPDRNGPVDALPLGTAKVAVLKGRRVLRQGTFTGTQEVKA